MWILSPHINDDIVRNVFNGNPPHPTPKTDKTHEALLGCKTQIFLLLVVVARSFLKDDYKERQKRIWNENIFAGS